MRKDVKKKSEKGIKKERKKDEINKQGKKEERMK